jgi:hypothetical protein
VTLDAFVAALKQTPHEEQTPEWFAYQQLRAQEYGLNWQAVCAHIATQQAADAADPEK